MLLGVTNSVRISISTLAINWDDRLCIHVAVVCQTTVKPLKDNHQENQRISAMKIIVCIGVILCLTSLAWAAPRDDDVGEPRRDIEL